MILELSEFLPLEGLYEAIGGHLGSRGPGNLYVFVLNLLIKLVVMNINVMKLHD